VFGHPFYRQFRVETPGFAARAVLASSILPACELAAAAFEHAKKFFRSVSSIAQRTASRRPRCEFDYAAVAVRLTTEPLCGAMVGGRRHRNGNGRHQPERHL
jgi:hypothetical protein